MSKGPPCAARAGSPPLSPRSRSCRGCWPSRPPVRPPAPRPWRPCAKASLLHPADGVRRARITYTSHGIPHIVARDYESLGYGEGFATARTSICNLADTVLTARGLRSRYLGPDKRYNDGVTLDATNLQTDTLFTDIRNRGVVRHLLADPKAGPGQQTRALVRGYAAGVNKYLRSIGGSRHVTDPGCRGRAWVRADITPFDIWSAIYSANLLASTGVFVPQIADAAPPSATDPTDGLPQSPVSAPSTAQFAKPPVDLPSQGRPACRVSARTRPRPSAPTPPRWARP